MTDRPTFSRARLSTLTFRVSADAATEVEAEAERRRISVSDHIQWRGLDAGHDDQRRAK